MTPLKESTIQAISDTEVRKVKETLEKVAEQKKKNCFSKHNAIAAEFPHLLFRTIVQLENDGYKVKRHSWFFGFFTSYSVIA